MTASKHKLGIALSGGGAKGIAHIGVLKALEEHGIFPDIIAGTSAGAIVGALYASGKTATEILRFVEKSNVFKIFKFGVPTKGLTDLSYLSKILSEVIVEDSFEALHKKLYIPISNLSTGKLDVINSGSLFDVVTASCSIPFIFTPVKINDYYYVDGGLMNNLPVEAIREKVEYAIAVNVMPVEPAVENEFQNLFQIANRTFYLSIWSNTASSLAISDIIIEPKDMNNYKVYHFNKVDEFFELGYESGLEAIPQIMSLLS